MTQANWYNAERVSQPGSVILNAWRADRQLKASGNLTQQNLTVQELANLIGGGGSYSGGPVVSESTAMRVSAVYACVALIAGAISTLPMPIYARNGKGREETDHPYYWLLNEQPNDDISAAVFWEYLVSSRLFYGDCFAEIIRSSFRSSGITGFKPLHPNRVTPFRTADDRLFYRITPLIGAEYTLLPADIIHVPSLGYDGLRSPSPITYAARQAVGTAQSAGEYNSRFFTNGARADFALKVPGQISADQANMLRATWGENHAGVAKSHLPAILMGGMEVEQLSMSAADSQVLATCQFQIEEIARALGVPPHMIGHTDKSTSWGSGVENMGRGFVKFTLKRDLVKFEQEINRKLWPVRQKFFVEFDLADIERGDLKSENEALRIALGRAGEPGWITQNEVRKAKLLPPKEGGDELLEVVQPTGPTEKDTQQATAKNLADMRVIANEAQKPTIVNVAAPIVNVTVPEQAAPVVQNTVNLPETVVNVEAVMPEQAAPVVHIAAAPAPVINVTNQVPAQAAPHVRVFNDVKTPEVNVNLPARRTDTTIIRDGNGNISKATQIEQDV